jgi:hypothetical protein
MHIFASNSQEDATALHWVTSGGRTRTRTDCARLLVEAGARVDAKDNVRPICGVHLSCFGC